MYRAGSEETQGTQKGETTGWEMENRTQDPHLIPGLVAHRIPALVLLMVVLLGVGLRLYDLGGKSMWDDEVITVQISRGDLNHIWKDLMTLQRSPPLHYWLVHLCLKLGIGNDELRARLPSALLGIASIPLLYLLTCALFGQNAALAAAVLLAFSPFHVYYSQEARTYAQFVFLSLASFSFAFALMRRHSWSSWVGYVVSGTLGLYTHYFMMFYFLSQGLIILIFLGFKRKGFKRKEKIKSGLAFLIAWAVIASLYVPVYVLMLHGAPAGSGTPIGEWTIPLIIAKLRLFWAVLAPLAGSKNQILIACLLVCMFGLGIFSASRRSAQVLLFLLIWMTIPLFGGIAFLEGRSFFNERYFIPATIPFLILVGVGIERVVHLFSLLELRLRRGSPEDMRFRPVYGWLVSLIVLVMIVPIFLPSLGAYYATEKLDYKGARAYVGKRMLPGDSIVLIGFGAPWLAYYFADMGTAVKAPETADALEALSQPGRRVWFVYGWADLGPNGPRERELFDWSQKVAKQRVTLPGGNSNVRILRWGPDGEAVLQETLRRSLSQCAGDAIEADIGLEVADSLLTLGRWQDALNLYNKTASVLWTRLTRDPDNIVDRRRLTAVLLGSGEAAARLGDRSSAVGYYGDALAVDPTTMSQRGDYISLFEEYFEDQLARNPSGFQEVNMLSNPNFERGASGWLFDPAWNINGSTKAGVENSHCHEGTGCGVIQYSVPGNHMGWFQATSVKPRTLYLYSAFFRTREIKDFNVRALMWSLGNDWNFKRSIEADSEWERIVYVFRTPAINDMNLFPATASGQGQVWIDQVVFMELPLASAQALALEVARLEKAWGRARGMKDTAESTKIYSQLNDAYARLATKCGDMQDLNKEREIYRKSLALEWEGLQLGADYPLHRADYLAKIKKYYESGSRSEIASIRNLLSNSGFESGLKGWEPFQPEGAKSVFQASSQTAHGGRFSVHLQGLNSNYQGGLVTYVELEPITIYRFSVWIKSTQARSLAIRTLYVDYRYQNGTSGGQPMGRQLNGSQDWHRESVWFITPENIKGGIFMPVLFTGEGEIWIDDVRLDKIDPSMIAGKAASLDFHGKPFG